MVLILFSSFASILNREISFLSSLFLRNWILKSTHCLFLKPSRQFSTAAKLQKIMEKFRKPFIWKGFQFKKILRFILVLPF